MSDNKLMEQEAELLAEQERRLEPQQIDAEERDAVREESHDRT